MGLIPAPDIAETYGSGGVLELASTIHRQSESEQLMSRMGRKAGTLALGVIPLHRGWLCTHCSTQGFAHAKTARTCEAQT